MTHELEPLERFRQFVASFLHLPLAAIGLYAERYTPHDQYALTVRVPAAEFEARLHHLGFVRNFVSSLKTREYHAPAEVSVASWVHYPEGAFRSSHQLHLALYVGPNEESTDIYAHWEPSWIRHPIRHYRAREVDTPTGVAQIRTILSESGIEYIVKPVAERYQPKVELP